MSATQHWHWSKNFFALDLNEYAQQPNENPERLRLLSLVLGRQPRNVGFWHTTDVSASWSVSPWSNFTLRWASLRCA